MNDSPEPLRIGLVGSGHATADLHLPALRHVPTAAVRALCDVDRDRLHRTADAFRIAKRYDDFRTLVADPGIDIVGVCAPTPEHASIALAAFDAGKHVLIEKPATHDLVESAMLLERSKSLASKAMVGFNLRHHPFILEARRLIGLGALGRVEAVHTVFTTRHGQMPSLPQWRKGRGTGGGALLDLGVHHFDLLRFLFDCEPREIFATTRSERSPDQTIAVTVRLDNDAVCTSTFSTVTSDTNEVSIFGQSGALFLSLYRFDGFNLVFSPAPRHGARGRFSSLLHTLGALPVAARMSRQGGVFISSYQAQWSHLIECIRQNTPVGTSLVDSHRALELAYAAYDSIATRRARILKTSAHPTGEGRPL